MSKKKDFKRSPTESFFSRPPEADPGTPKRKPKQEQPPINKRASADLIPKGYILKPEAKSERLNLLIKPSTKEGIKEAAEVKRTSVNNLINEILEDYLKKAEGSI